MRPRASTARPVLAPEPGDPMGSRGLGSQHGLRPRWVASGPW